MTGDKAFLTSFSRAHKELPLRLAALHKQVENKLQKNRIAKITSLVEVNLGHLTTLSGNESEIASDFLIDQFKLQVKNMNNLQSEIKYFNKLEAILVEQDQANVNLQRRQNITITTIGAIGGIIGAILAVWLFSGTIVKRVKSLRDNAAHLARAEALELPSKSKDELGQLSVELEHASRLLAKNIESATLAKKEAEQANKDKSAFLSRTSHELRTPLNAILGFAQLLQTELKPGQNRDYVDLIKNAGDHLLKLINDVIDIAKIQSGELSLPLIPTPVNELIIEAVHYISPLGKIRDVEIKHSIEDNLFALADRQKLLQVLLNLLSNALKYGPANSAVLIKAYQDESTIIVEVFDEGLGIPDELKSRLFNAFDRLGAEHTKIEGTGIGLALSKQIMIAMQGSIHVSDNKSLFWIELQASAKIPSNKVNSYTILNTPKITPLLDKKSIIYVEDNISNRTLVEAVIKRLSHIKLLCTTTVKETKILLSEVIPALMIIDLHLPDESGEVLVNYMKLHEPLANIPIIVLSADATKDSIQRLESAGIDFYMTKPFNISEFLDNVSTLTQEKRTEIIDERS